MELVHIPFLSQHSRLDAVLPDSTSSTYRRPSAADQLVNWNVDSACSIRACTIRSSLHFLSLFKDSSLWSSNGPHDFEGIESSLMTGRIRAFSVLAPTSAYTYQKHGVFGWMALDRECLFSQALFTGRMVDGARITSWMRWAVL